MKSARLPLLLVIVGALAIAVAAPQPMSFGLSDVPFEIPPALYAVLIGIASSLITAGFGNRFPEIKDAAMVLASAIITTALDFLAGVITTGVPLEFWPLLTQALFLVVSWLSAWGTFKAAMGLKRSLSFG